MADQSQKTDIEGRVFLVDQGLLNALLVLGVTTADTQAQMYR